jgi:hypothetical protein
LPIPGRVHEQAKCVRSSDQPEQLSRLRAHLFDAARVGANAIYRQRSSYLLDYLHQYTKGRDEVAYVFGEALTGAYVKGFRKPWESAVLMAHGVQPRRAMRRGAWSDECKRRLREIDLHWHDLRHEGLSRYGEGGMLLSELQKLAGHADPRTTQRYEHVEPQRLSEAMVRAREKRMQLIRDRENATGDNGEQLKIVPKLSQEAVAQPQPLGGARRK